MIQAMELFRAGDLEAAVAASIEEVKSKPTDADSRSRMAELLCFTGDLERADKQLETVGLQNPAAVPSIALFRQLIRAEKSRAEFYNEGRVPEFVGGPNPLMQIYLQASVALRAGDLAEARNLLERAEAERPRVSGKSDDEPFDDFRDLDDLLGGVFEVLTSTGKYYWIPTSQVISLELRPIELTRDLIWRRCEMLVANGPQGEVFLPCLYHGSSVLGDRQLKLGRASDWIGEADGIIRGQGLRMYLVGEEARTIRELNLLEFDIELPEGPAEESA